MVHDQAGRTVIAGFFDVSSGDSDCRVVRLLPDGSTDRSFGTDGVFEFEVASDPPPDGSPFPGSSGDGLEDFCVDVAVQADGRIAVAGMTGRYGRDVDMFAARLLPDGGLDPAFGDGGVRRVNVGTQDEAAALALQPDGKMLVLGQVGTPYSRDIGLLRLTATGEQDPSFAGGRLQTTDLGSEDRAHDVALDPNGSIVVVGSAATVAGGVSPALLRYLPDGTPDPSFAPPGSRPDPFVSNARDALVLYDGRILVGGDGGSKEEEPDGGSDFDVAIARYQGRPGQEPTPQPTQRCVSPRLKRLRLPTARRRARSAGCRIGRVRRRASRRALRGRVVAQQPRAGTIHRRGKRISVVVGTRRKRR